MTEIAFYVSPIRPDAAVCRDDRNSREYRAGIRKLRAWHEEFRRKRNGTFVPCFDAPHVKEQGRRQKSTKGGAQ